MGRPSKGLRKQVTIRLPVTDARVMATQAINSGLSLSEHVAQVVAEHVRRSQRARQR